MNVRGRDGFTLIELVIVASIMSILGGLALPNLKAAVIKADAARIIADVRTVDLAARQFVEENGSLPRNSRWGSAPVDLVPYLGEMTFEYKTVEYRLIRNNRTGKLRLRVRYPRRDPIGAALARFARSGEVVWTNRRTDFYLID